MQDPHHETAASKASISSGLVRGFAVVGDMVEWTHYDRRGMKKFLGVVTGECPRRNTHLRVKTATGTRYVHRAHANPTNESR